MFSLPYTTRVLEAVRAQTGVPTIHYALESAHLLNAFTALPCDVLSVDHRESLASVRERTGGRFALQGNVEPGVMTASLDHCMWFYHPVKVDDWWLYAQDSPAAGGARGLARGTIYTRDGVLGCSVAQEVVLRTRQV